MFKLPQPNSKVVFGSCSFTHCFWLRQRLAAPSQDAYDEVFKKTVANCVWQAYVRLSSHARSYIDEINHGEYVTFAEALWCGPSCWDAPVNIARWRRVRRRACELATIYKTEDTAVSNKLLIYWLLIYWPRSWLHHYFTLRLYDLATLDIHLSFLRAIVRPHSLLEWANVHLPDLKNSIWFKVSWKQRTLHCSLFTDPLLFLYINNVQTPYIHRSILLYV